jgi:hypothetical protein
LLKDEIAYENLCGVRTIGQRLLAKLERGSSSSSILPYPQAARWRAAFFVSRRSKRLKESPNPYNHYSARQQSRKKR